VYIKVLSQLARRDSRKPGKISVKRANLWAYVQIQDLSNMKQEFQHLVTGGTSQTSFNPSILPLTNLKS
jgi:hypothetical protein